MRQERAGNPSGSPLKLLKRKRIRCPLIPQKSECGDIRYCFRVMAQSVDYGEVLENRLGIVPNFRSS
jgi:hypothetical protein